MSRGIVRALPGVAVSLAEAGWIAVLGALAAALGGSAPPAGPWSLAVLVALGLLVVRRAPGRRIVPAMAVTVTALVAWGLAALTTGLSPAFVPAGLAALAVWRGTRHATPELDDVVTADVLRLGLPALAVPWLVGAAAPEPVRGAFLAAALPATLLFVAGSLAAVGLTRLDALGRETGLDWTRNRAWLVLLGSILGGLVALTLPAAFLLGVPFGDVLRRLLEPVGAIADAGLTAVRTAADAVSGGVSTPPPAPSTPVALPSIALPAWLTIALSVVALGGFLAAAAYAARKVRGTPPDLSSDRRPAVERTFEFRLPRPSVSLPGHLHLPRRRGRPRTATEAYAAALEHLSRDAGLARRPSESPRAHAARTRHALGWRMSLLAADYELERYARLVVTAAERRRALGRADWVRRR